MKKMFVFTAILFLTAVNIFAQISFGAWGRGAFVPLNVYSEEIDKDGNKMDPNDNRAKYGDLYAGTGGTRVYSGFEQELYLRGTSDHIGFQLGLAFDGEGTNDTKKTSQKYWYNPLGAAIWVKPFGNDLLKITGGRFTDDTLRGKIGESNAGFQEFVLRHEVDTALGRSEPAGFKDDIFSNFNTNGGFMISSSPLEGLFIGLLFNAVGLFDAPDAANRVEDVYRNIHAGVGYEIPGIGHARLQYFGGYLGQISLKRTQEYINEANIDWNTGMGSTPDNLLAGILPRDWHDSPAHMEAAFALALAENLVLDIGFKYYFSTTTSGKLQFISEDYILPYQQSSYGMALSAGFTYSFEALPVDILNNFRISGRVDSTFGAYKRFSEDDKSLNKSGAELPKQRLDVRVAPSYNFGPIEVGVDFGYKMMGKEILETGIEDSTTGYSQWGVGAFGRMNFTNGIFTFGVSYTNPKVYELSDKMQDRRPMLQVPVIMEFSF